MTWIILSARLLDGTLYLDPGSGSYILQLLIAVAMGSALAIKIYWKKIVSYFKKGEASSETTEEKPSIDDEK